MNNIDIKNYLDNMYNNREEFARTHGASSLYDSKFMIISDILSEHTSLLADIIVDELNKESISSSSKFRAVELRA